MATINTSTQPNFVLVFSELFLRFSIFFSYSAAADPSLASPSQVPSIALKSWNATGVGVGEGVGLGVAVGDGVGVDGDTVAIHCSVSSPRPRGPLHMR